MPKILTWRLVCVDARSRAAVRRAVAQQEDVKVQYHEHEYQVPEKSKRSVMFEDNDTYDLNTMVAR